MVSSVANPTTRTTSVRQASVLPTRETNARPASGTKNGKPTRSFFAALLKSFSAFVA